MNTSLAVIIDRGSVSTYPGNLRILLTGFKLTKLGIAVAASKAQ